MTTDPRSDGVHGAVDVGSAVPGSEADQTSVRDQGSRRPRRAGRPFVVQVAALRKQTGGTRQVVRQAPIDGLSALGVFVPADGEVSVDLTLSAYPGGITAAGTVTAPWVGECRRCGGPVHGEVVAEVREHYAPAGGAGPPGDEEETYALTGDELDLEPLARDAVMLDLPLAPLCTEACLGLCPRCGANRNAAPCDCAPETDPRWSALDALRAPEAGGLA